MSSPAVFALVADGSLGVSELLRLGATAVLGENLVSVLSNRFAALVQAVVVFIAGTATSTVGMRPSRRDRPYVSVVTALVIGVTASVVLAGVHLRARHAGGSFNASTYYYAADAPRASGVKTFAARRRAPVDHGSAEIRCTRAGPGKLTPDRVLSRGA